MQEQKCFMCNCTEKKACYHPNYGSCYWYDDDKTLCSHCALPDVIPVCNRPRIKIGKTNVIYPRHLRWYFKIVMPEAEVGVENYINELFALEVDDAHWHQFKNFVMCR